MAELADVRDLGSRADRRVGSSPTFPTIEKHIQQLYNRLALRIEKCALYYLLAWTELADAADSKSVGRNTVWVQVPPPAPYTPVAQWNRAIGYEPICEGSILLWRFMKKRRGNMVGIYKITDKTNGKVYIGSSCNIEKRIQLHRSSLKRNIGDCVLLQDAYNDHPNIENFDFVVIEEMPNNTTKSDLYDREDYWMSVYNSRNPLIGYNLSKARQSGEHHSSQLGEKNNNYGKHHTEKAKSKMKSAWTTERRAALSERNRKRWNEYRLNNIGA